MNEIEKKIMLAEQEREEILSRLRHHVSQRRQLITASQMLDGLVRDAESEIDNLEQQLIKQTGA